MSRKVSDCREFPSETGCTLIIAGEEEEVVEAACLHAVAVHQETDTPELREAIRDALKEESDYLHESSEQELPPYAEPAPPLH